MLNIHGRNCNRDCTVCNVAGRCADDAIESTLDRIDDDEPRRASARPTHTQRIDALRLSELDKSLPAEADGRTMAEFLASRPRLSAFSTPLLVLDDAAIDENIAADGRLVRRRTVSSSRRTARRPWPRRCGDGSSHAGAWGITLATSPSCAWRCASACAGSCSPTPSSTRSRCRWLARELRGRRPRPRGADLGRLARHGRGDGRRAGRTRRRRPVTGARRARRPRRAHRCPRPSTRRVRGRRRVAASGAPAPGRRRRLRGRAGPRRVRRSRLARGARLPAASWPRCTAACAAAAGTQGTDRCVTAGGSAYFDEVAEVLAPLADRPGTHAVLLRSGAYVIHDDGLYRGISPLARPEPRRAAAPVGDARLGPGRVPPRARPGAARRRQARRPVRRGPARCRSWPPTSSGAPPRPLAGARSPRSTTSTPSCGSTRREPAGVGDVVRLGLSHPCTAFDKWRLIPVVDGADGRRSSTSSAPSSDEAALRMDARSSATPPSSTAPARRATAPTWASTAAGSPPSDPSGGPPAGRPRSIDADGPGPLPRLHRHARALATCALLRDPDHQAKVAQGVTLEVLGQDGLSYAPVDDAALGRGPAQDRRLERRPRTDFDFDWRTVGEYLDRLDRGHRRQRRLPRPAGHGPAAASSAGTTAPATAAEIAADAAARRRGPWQQGAVGHVLRPHLHPGHVRRRRRTDSRCAGWWPSYGGYYCPHHRSYGAGALEAYAEMVDLDPRRRLRPPPRPRHHELRREQGPGAGAARPARRGARRRRGHHPRHLPVPARLHHAVGDAAELGAARAARRQTLRPAAGPGRAERIRRAPGGQTARTAATACPSSGTPSRSAGVQQRRSSADCVGQTVAAVAAPRRASPVRRVRRLLIARPTSAPTILQHVGHEENVRAIMRHRVHTGGSDGTPGRRASRTRGRGARSRATSAATAASWACSPWRSASAHLTGRAAAPAAAARPRPGPRGLRRRPGAVRPGHGGRHRHLRQPAPAGAPGIPYVLVNGELAIDDGDAPARPPGRCAAPRAEEGAVSDDRRSTCCAPTAR